MHSVGSQGSLGERNPIHIEILGNEIRIDHVAMDTLRNGVVEIGLRRIVMHVSCWFRNLKFIDGNRLVVFRARGKTANMKRELRQLLHSN